MSTDNQFLSKKSKVLENTAFLYLKALWIFFGPTMTTIFIIHYLICHFFTSIAWISFWVALLIPLTSLIGVLMDISFLSNEPIIYNLTSQREDIKKISKFILIKTLLFLLGYFCILRTLHITDFGNKTLNFPIIFFIFITGYLINDLLFYLLHRLFHMSKFLFRNFHIYHHQTTVTTMLTHHRMSLLENDIPNFIVTILGSIVIGYYSAYILPEAYSYLIGYMLVAAQMEYTALLGHSNREFLSHKIEKIFPFNILSTTVMHAIHHARMKTNYAAFSKVWDKMFGTLSTDHEVILKRVSQGTPLVKLSERFNSFE
jgi:sterol desaturase/sphingolipid hydroxylase (fatty acid hydroxylase superfamily)